MSSLKLEVGSMFAEKYRIIEPLSEGGMGALYVVENVFLTKTLALKLMHPNLAGDETLRRRFLTEARIAAKIKNGHIVDVQDVGIDQTTNIPWMAMELLEGEDLKLRIRQGLPSVETAYEILRQVFIALEAAHQLPVVHRDLKPANIFLAKPNVGEADFVVKVLDFGIAKEVTEAASQTMEAMGTPLWMAPEQTVPRSNIRPSADIWSLGLIAFHVLTGKLFWKSANKSGAGAGELMRQVLIDPIPLASERALEFGVPDRIPPGFDEWFARCVDREPQARFQDAGQAWRMLDHVLRGVANLDELAAMKRSSQWRQSQTGPSLSQMGFGAMAQSQQRVDPGMPRHGDLSANDVRGNTAVAIPRGGHSAPSVGALQSLSSQGLATQGHASQSSMAHGFTPVSPNPSNSFTPVSNPRNGGLDPNISSTGINPGVVQVLQTAQPPRTGQLPIMIAAAAFGITIATLVIVLKGSGNKQTGNGSDDPRGDPTVEDKGQANVRATEIPVKVPATTTAVSTVSLPASAAAGIPSPSASSVRVTPSVKKPNPALFPEKKKSANPDTL